MKKYESNAKITVYVDEESKEKLKNYLEIKEFNDTEYIIEYPLTQREKQVLYYIMDGKSNTEIAKILKLSPYTIKAHTGKIFSKLGVKDRIQAAIKAIRERIF